MNPTTPDRPHADWRWFPRALIASLGVVFAVNAYMVYAAVITFPGEAGQDGFDLSNAYDRILDLSARQSALGWHVTVDAEPGRHPRITVTDRTAAPMPHLTIEARAERPLGPRQETTLLFHPAGPGRHSADQPLAPGRWTLFVTIRQDGETLTTTAQLTLP